MNGVVAPASRILGRLLSCPLASGEVRDRDCRTAVLRGKLQIPRLRDWIRLANPIAPLGMTILGGRGRFVPAGPAVVHAFARTRVSAPHGLAGAGANEFDVFLLEDVYRVALLGFVEGDD